MDSVQRACSKVLSVPSICLPGHHGSGFGFKCYQNENVHSSQWQLPVFVTLIWCLFFFLFLFKTRQLFTSCLKLPNPLFPGHVFSSITHPLAAALCVVQAQLNVQLCGELVQLKNYLAEVMQLPQNVKPQPRVLSEEVEWSCRLVDPGNTANPVKAL